MDSYWLFYISKPWVSILCTVSTPLCSNCRALCKTELSRLYIKIGAQAVSSCQNSMRISCNMLIFFKKKTCFASYLASKFILGYLEAHNFMLWKWKFDNNFEEKIGIDSFLTWYDQGVGDESLTIILVNYSLTKYKIFPCSFGSCSSLEWSLFLLDLEDIMRDITD